MAQSLDIANPVYPANRAMANLKLKNWKEAEEDCTRALRHDPTYEKALEWYDSEEYKPVKPIRLANSVANGIIIKGI